jgi:hypothetical protein
LFVCHNIEPEMEEPTVLDRPKTRFFTKGAAATKNLEYSESRILEVNGHIRYRDHNLGTEKDCVMMVALMEDLDSIKDSILERFQHLSPKPGRVTLMLLWLGGPLPPLFDSPSHIRGENCKAKRCRTLKPLNIGLWLRHWKDVDGGNELKSKNRLIVELHSVVENEGKEIGGKPAADANDATSQKRYMTRQSSMGRAQTEADSPSQPVVVPPASRYPRRERTIASREAISQMQDKKHDNATERRHSRKQINAALSIKEGDVVGGKAPALGPGNKGHAMMEKMGWSEGMGLGAPHKQCDIQLIPQVFKISRTGLGASRIWDNPRPRRDPPPGDYSREDKDPRMEAAMRKGVGSKTRDDPSPLIEHGISKDG